MPMLWGGGRERVRVRVRVNERQAQARAGSAASQRLANLGERCFAALGKLRLGLV